MCEYCSYRFAAICRWIRICHLQHERLYDMNYLKTANCLMHVKLLKKQLMAEMSVCWVFFYAGWGGWSRFELGAV